MTDGGRARAGQVQARQHSHGTVGLRDGRNRGNAGPRPSSPPLRTPGRRYVERARDEGAMEVPGAKLVFTVKLPAGLARRVRGAAGPPGRASPALVSEALSEFLDRHHGGGHGKRKVSVEFVFDRSADQALARAYRVLVPERRARTMQRKSDDHSQMVVVAPTAESRLEPVTNHDEEKTARPSGHEASSGRAGA